MGLFYVFSGSLLRLCARLQLIDSSEEEDACVSYEEEDTCVHASNSLTHVFYVLRRSLLLV